MLSPQKSTTFVLKQQNNVMEKEIQFREATSEDLVTIVKMLADDPIGSQRESTQEPLLPSYLDAFSAIAQDKNNELILATIEEKVVGVIQITFIPYINRKGSWRALIEGVRTATDYRSQGIGRKMFEWAIEKAKQRNCHIVQLTSDKRRPNAIRFYESLGFEASHEGMKLYLT